MVKGSAGLWCKKDNIREADAASQSSSASSSAEHPIEMIRRDRQQDSAVGQRKAFFEAMIRSNSDTLITVSTPAFLVL